MTPFWRLRGGVTGFPMATSQIRAVESQLTVARKRPSRQKVMQVILYRCPNGGVNGRPDTASPMRAVAGLAGPFFHCLPPQASVKDWAVHVFGLLNRAETAPVAMPAL